MPRKEVKRLALCKNLVVANDDSIAYLRPSPLQRRVRADLGAADLRRLARRPLLPQGARVAAVHEYTNAEIENQARQRPREPCTATGIRGRTVSCAVEIPMYVVPRKPNRNARYMLP